MWGTLTNCWRPNSSAPNDNPTSHLNRSATTDETMDPDGPEDVLMISERAPAPEECLESRPRASDAQYIRRDAFEFYKQKQARAYSHLNDQNVRLRKLDLESRENIKGLVKKLAWKTDEAQEAQQGLFDIQEELNASKEEQKRLERDLVRAQAEVVACKRELKECEGTIAHFHDIGKDLQMEQKAHEATQRELQACKADQYHAQVNGAELQGLREKVAASQRELSACKDDLFRLQPFAQIPDSDISRDFDFICQQIVNWIDMELLEFEHANPHLSQKDFFSTGGDIKIAQRVHRNTELGEYLSRYMIHYYLVAKLFGPSCSLLGVTRSDQELLQRTVRSMAKLEPPRDAATVSAWRSEALKAITRTEESQKLQEKQIQAITMDMFESLSETLPVVFGNLESMDRFHEQIMQPASKLATTLRASCSTYRFQIAEAPFPNFKPVTTNFIKTNSMIDVKTRMTLKPNTSVVADENGVFGKCIMMLEPTLYRVSKDKRNSKLRQGAYLVELDHPITKPIAQDYFYGLEQRLGGDWRS